MTTFKFLKENYPGVYEAACRAQVNQGNPNYSDDTIIGRIKFGGGFDWDLTPEGDKFWLCICNKQWDIAQKLVPALFSPKSIVKYPSSRLKIFIPDKKENKINKLVQIKVRKIH